MAQVYAIMHDGQGEFLIAFKNSTGYFFCNPSGVGFVLPAGIPINGGANWAFPGGSLGGQPVSTAIELLYMQTGIKLNASMAAPDIYNGAGFYGIYFNLGNNFGNFQVLIQNSLLAGSQAATAIKYGTYSLPAQYQELMEAFIGCPPNNELDAIYKWNLKTNIGQINLLKTNTLTDSCFECLVNLSLQIYGVIITDSDGQLAGIGNQVAQAAGQFTITDFTPDPLHFLPGKQYSVQTRTNLYNNLSLTGLNGSTAILQV